MSRVFMINPGRMACALYLALMLYWLRVQGVQFLSWKWSAIFCTCILSLLLISPTCQQGLANLMQDSHLYKTGDSATSLGFRVQFHHFAYTLFSQHWLIGNGAGSYAYWFKQLNPVPAWQSSPNTHSQYWLITAETGLIGFALWINWFAALWRHASRCGTYGQHCNALLLIIALNSLTDNVLDVSVGYLFLAITALAYADTSSLDSYQGCQ